MNRSITPALLLAVGLAGLAGCDKEQGRVPFSDEGEAEAKLMLQPGKVSFWTDLDIEWKAPAELEYRVELLQGGAVVDAAMCNPLERLKVRVGWVETNVNQSHSRRGNGKLGCSANLGAGGETTVRATLRFRQRPEQVLLKKADLVVKQ